MSVVPLEQVWVDANFKEWQLRHIRVGQPVELTADVYGSLVVYHGKVAGFTPGTGSALALLPAQNATGNWIKVVQRLPVRIEIPPAELEKHPLRVGLSMNVDVDVKDPAGTPLGTRSRVRPTRPTYSPDMATTRMPRSHTSSPPTNDRPPLAAARDTRRAPRARYTIAVSTMTTNHPNHPPLTGATLALGSLSVGLAGFMTVLDSSIANVAIPTISGNLGVSVDEGTWVITVFAAANAIAIPLTGWLTQRLGQVRLFVGSILLFVFASWLCGIAPTLPILLACACAAGRRGRTADSNVPGIAAQFVAKGEILAGALALLDDRGDRTDRRAALGGWVTDSYSWSWIFYINIPVGLFAAAMVWLLYRKRDTPARKLPVDVVGLVLLIVWVASLQVMLDKGKDLDWFSSSTIVILTIVAAVGLAVFIVWELTEKNPIVDLTLFKQRNFLGGTVSIAVAYGIFFGTLVLLPQWMQEYLGYRAVDAGLATAPLGIFAVIGAPIMGKILPRSDARIIGTFAFIGFAIVYYMRTYFYTDLSEGYIILPTLLQGIPMALFFAPLTVIICQGSRPRRCRPPRACPPSDACSSAASARRWQVSWGTTGRSCIMKS